MAAARPFTAVSGNHGFRLFAVAFILHLAQFLQVQGEDFTMEVFLTKPNPTKPDTYLSETKALPADKTYYIVGFEPTVTMDIVHHMIVTGCDAIQESENGLYCNGASTYMYAWAKNAPPLYLPEGVGFKIGEDGYKGIVLQLHFSDVTKLAGKDLNRLGVRIIYTDVPQPKLASVYLLGAGGGSIQPNKTETFDVACRVDDDVKMHIFAFRPHTHHLGTSVVGYRGTSRSDGTLDWTLIGKENPQKPQMFYRVKEVVVEKGDILAARCTMFNFKDQPVGIGGTSHDEMCNFYAMYWVDDGKFRSRSSCFSQGPPGYYWEKDSTLPNVPIDSEHWTTNL